MSHHSSKNAKITILGIISAAYLLSVTWVGAAIANSDSGVWSQVASEPTLSQFTTDRSTTPEFVSESFILDLVKVPEVAWTMSSNASSYKFVIATKESSDGWKIAVHLKELKSVTPHSTLFMDNRVDASSPGWTAEQVLDNLLEATIIPNLNHNSNGDLSNYEKAQFVISIYKDVPGSNNCPDSNFNCYSKNNATSRCIPDVLKCNKNPNCGMQINIDEDDCYSCRSDASGNSSLSYIVTSLAIGILLILQSNC